jgi:hypothetical protein
MAEGITPKGITFRTERKFVMNRKTILTGIAAFSATMMIAGMASAVDYTWIGTDDGRGIGDGFTWQDVNNWAPNSGYPSSANDKAFFDGSQGDGANIAVTDFPNSSMTVSEINLVNNITVTVSDAAAYVLNLTGSLIVPAGSDLRLSTNITMSWNTASVDHLLGGRLELAAASSILQVNADGIRALPNSGTYGAIRGSDNSAKIRIVANANFTSQITTEGKMQMEAISGTATFTLSRVAADAASGLVNANQASGTLALNSNLKLVDSNSGANHARWRASSFNSAVLQFNRACDGSDAAHPTLVGDFELFNCATIDVNAYVHSSGGFGNFAGTIDASGGRLQTDSTTVVDVNGTTSTSGGC